MLGLRLYERARTEAIESLIVGGGPPAALGGTRFEADDLIEDVLPSALADHGVGVAEVNARQTQIQSGLAGCVVKSVQQPLGFRFVFGLEALERLGGVVEGVINALATEE